MTRRGVISVGWNETICTCRFALTFQASSTFGLKTCPIDIFFRTQWSMSDKASSLLMVYRHIRICATNQNEVSRSFVFWHRQSQSVNASSTGTSTWTCGESGVPFSLLLKVACVSRLWRQRGVTSATAQLVSSFSLSQRARWSSFWTIFSFSSFRKMDRSNSVLSPCHRCQWLARHECCDDKGPQRPMYGASLVLTHCGRCIDLVYLEELAYRHFGQSGASVASNSLTSRWTSARFSSFLFSWTCLSTIEKLL